MRLHIESGHYPPMDLQWISKGLAKEGKTRAGLAKALGVQPPQVTRLLQGKRQLKASEIGKVARYLEVEPPADIGSFSPVGNDGDGLKAARHIAEQISMLRQQPLSGRDLAWLTLEVHKLMREPLPE